MKNRFDIESMIKNGLVELSPGVWGKSPPKSFGGQKSKDATQQEGIYTFDVTPIGKPSFQKSDKWRTKDHSDPKMRQRPNVGRWIEFKKALTILAQKQGFIMPASKSTILFILPMKKSWSNKKKAIMYGKPHQSKPDADNLCKAFFDSVCPEDDSYIWEYLVAKRWGKEGKIIITVNNGE